jgi:dTDP-4-amino-4,6-dideoxygalactose transaminase
MTIKPPIVRSIPMLDLGREYDYMKQDIDRAIERCLGHQQWILGPEVEEFETTASEYLGARHCIGTSSGTDALVLALRALAIKLTGREYFSRRDHIITTPFTFTATGDAILRAGATPVFVDINPETYNIDPDKIREYLTQAASGSGGRPSPVVGILPVHLYGRPCNMDQIESVAREYGLFVVEDVAQAIGATWRGRKVGSFGQCGAFSFFPSKNLGAFGDAGMVSTNDDELASLIRMLLKHGGKDKYNADHIGYNARLDTLQAAILLARFGYLDEFNERRRGIAKIYSAGLCDVKEIVLPVDMVTPQPIHGVSSYPSVDHRHVFHQYTIRSTDGRRDELQKFLRERGIAIAVYYPVPLHRMRVFVGRSVATDCPNAEIACAQVASLPMDPLMKEEAIEKTVTTVKAFSSRPRELRRATEE